MTAVIASGPTQFPEGFSHKHAFKLSEVVNHICKKVFRSYKFCRKFHGQRSRPDLTARAADS